MSLLRCQCSITHRVVPKQFEVKANKERLSKQSGWIPVIRHLGRVRERKHRCLSSCLARTPSDRLQLFGSFRNFLNPKSFYFPRGTLPGKSTRFRKLNEHVWLLFKELSDLLLGGKREWTAKQKREMFKSTSKHWNSIARMINFRSFAPIDFWKVTFVVVWTSLDWRGAFFANGLVFGNDLLDDATHRLWFTMWMNIFWSPKRIDGWSLFGR